jgi:hypothetical protein
MPIHTNIRLLLATAFLILSSNLWLPKGSFPSYFVINILCIFFLKLRYSMCSAYCIPCDLITQIIICED